LRRGPRICEETRTHRFHKRIKVCNVLGVFLVIRYSIYVITKFLSNTANFGKRSRLVLFKSLEEANDFRIQLGQVRGLLHTFIHSIVDIGFQTKMSAVKRF